MEKFALPIKNDEMLKSRQRKRIPFSIKHIYHISWAINLSFCFTNDFKCQMDYQIQAMKETPILLITKMSPANKWFIIILRFLCFLFLFQWKRFVKDFFSNFKYNFTKIQLHFLLVHKILECLLIHFSFWFLVKR